MPLSSSRKRLLRDLSDHADRRITQVLGDTFALIGEPEEHAYLVFGTTVSVLSHFADTIASSVPAFRRLSRAERVYLMGLIVAQAESRDVQRIFADPRSQKRISDAVRALAVILERIDIH